MTFAPVEPDIDSDVEPSADVDAGGTSESDSSDAEDSPSDDKNAARDETLAKLQAPGGRAESSSQGPFIRVPSNIRRRSPDAVIVLKEERVSCCQSRLGLDTDVSPGKHLPRFPPLCIPPVSSERCTLSIA